METHAFILVALEHRHLVKNDAKTGRCSGGDDGDEEPHGVAVLIGNAKRVGDDHDGDEDEARNMGECLRGLNGARHDVEGPEHSEVDVEREIRAEPFEPDGGENKCASFLEIVDEEEDDAEDEEGGDDDFEGDLTCRLLVGTDTEGKDAELVLELVLSPLFAAELTVLEVATNGSGIDAVCLSDVILDFPVSMTKVGVGVRTVTSGRGGVGKIRSVGGDNSCCWCISG